MLTTTLSADGPSAGLSLAGARNRVSISTEWWGSIVTSAALQYSPDNGATVPWVPVFRDTALDYKGDPTWDVPRVPLRANWWTQSLVDMDGGGFVRMVVKNYRGSSPITLAVIDVG